MTAPSRSARWTAPPFARTSRHSAARASRIEGGQHRVRREAGIRFAPGLDMGMTECIRIRWCGVPEPDVRPTGH